jgi:nucleoid DNA-binding protein
MQKIRGEFQRVEREVLGGHPQQVREKPYETPEDLAPGEVSASTTVEEMERVDPFAAHPVERNLVTRKATKRKARTSDLIEQVMIDLGISRKIVHAVIFRYLDLVLRSIAMDKPTGVGGIGQLRWVFKRQRTRRSWRLVDGRREYEPFMRVTPGYYTLRLQLSPIVHSMLKLKQAPIVGPMVIFTPEERQASKDAARKQAAEIREALAQRTKLRSRGKKKAAAEPQGSQETSQVSVDCG